MFLDQPVILSRQGFMLYFRNNIKNVNIVHSAGQLVFMQYWAI